MRSSLLVALLSTAALVACGSKHGGGDDDGTDGGGKFDSLDVEPATQTLTVALDGSATQAYTVAGIKNGVMTDLTASCTLAIDPLFGTAAAQTVTLGPHGGTTMVTATCGGQAGTATLTVNLNGAVTTGSNTPANAADLFAAATAGTTPASTPAVEYPIDQAVAPVNMPAIDVQWTTASNDLFHISLVSTNVTVDVYTTDADAQLSDADWAAITSTTAGGALAITVEGLVQATPTTKYASTPVSLALSHDTIDTSALYYWASSAGDIMTETFGPQETPTVLKDDCSACHSLSRAGTRLAYNRCVKNAQGNAVCGPQYNGFLHYDPVAGWTETVNADNKAIAGSYSTFAPLGNPFPDDSQSIAAITGWTNGTLSLYDPDTGNAVPSNLATVSSHKPGTPATAGYSALMPDWSADGTKIVYAATAGVHQVDLDGGIIAITGYSYTGGVHTFTEPTALVTPPIMLTNPATMTAQSYENLFFPSFSPDGKLVVFNAARAQWRNNSAGQAASPGQRLMLADAGGNGVVDLTQINAGYADQNTTWPHWAPGETTDYYWVVFSSERPYGHEVTKTTSTGKSCVQNGILSCKQLWIGAISKAKLAAGLPADPSSPAMWLPGQDKTQDNISPYWTLPPGLQ